MSKRVFKNPRLVRKMLLPSDKQKEQGERVVVKYTLLTWEQRKRLTYNKFDLSSVYNGKVKISLTMGEMIDIIKFSVRGVEYEDGSPVQLEGGATLPQNFNSEKDIDLFLSLISDEDISEIAMKVYNDSTLSAEKKTK